MVEKQKLLKSTQTTGTSSSTAVGRRRDPRRKAAVPDEPDHLAVRPAQLGADGRSGRKAHGGHAAAGDERERMPRQKLLARAILVPAHVRDDDGVVGQNPIELGQQSRRVDGLGILGLDGLHLLRPAGLALSQRLQPGGRPGLLEVPAPQCVDELPQPSLGVGHDADLDG